VVNSVRAGRIIDFLFQVDVIGHEDLRKLQKFRDDAQEQCRELLSQLYTSENPQAFIHLYAAVRNESHLQWLTERLDHMDIGKGRGKCLF